MPINQRIEINSKWADVIINHIETDNKFDGVYINISDVTESVKNAEDIEKAMGKIVISVQLDNIMQKGFDVAGNDLSVGADILTRLSLDDEFKNASGKYYDNDSKRFI